MQGIESLWILGDTTMNMLAQYRAGTSTTAAASRNESYIAQHFKMSITASGGKSNINSPIARIINGFIKNYNEQKKLPKWVMIVPEDDLINMFLVQNNLSLTYQMVIEFITSEIEKVATAIKESLPNKAKKYGWPFIIWVEPVLHTNLHDNRLRSEFILSLHKTILMHNTSLVLQPRQAWSADDMELMDWQRQKFTDEGKQLFWCSMEQMARFADIKIMRNAGVGNNFNRIYQKERLKKEAEERIQRYQLRQQQRMEAKRRQHQQQIRNIIANIKGNTGTESTNNPQRAKLGKKNTPPSRRRLFKE